MIKEIFIYDLVNKKYYFQKLKNLKTLFYSKQNNKGKTLILKSILRCLSTGENMQVKEDKIDLKKIFISLKINNNYYARYNEDFYWNGKIIDVLEYNKKIIFEFDNGEIIIPPILNKDNSFSYKYLDQFWTFFYIDSDKTGDFTKQLKNTMFTKKNIDNYYFLLWKQNHKLIENINLFVKEIQDSRIKEKNLNLLNQLIDNSEKIINALSNNININLSDNYINEKITELEKLNKKYIENKLKINDNKKIIEFLISYKYNFYDSILKDLKKEIKIYVPIENEEKEIIISLVDFQKEIFENINIFNNMDEPIRKAKQEIENLEIDMNNDIKKINTIKKEISLYKSSNKNQIVSSLFIDNVLNSDISQVNILKSEINNIKNSLKNIKKDMSKFNKESLNEFDNLYSEFKSKNNLFGGTNSSKYDNFLFRYYLLNQNQVFQKIPLIIDNFGGITIDNPKTELLLSMNDNNQKIFSITYNNIDIFKNNGFDVIDLSSNEQNYMLLSNDINQINDIETKQHYSFINKTK